LSTWFVILTLVTIGTIALSYRRAAVVEEKMQRVLREFQKLGENLDEMQSMLQGSVDELRKEIYDKLTTKKP
jgi:DNA anti-recombination protein RmuC